MRAARAERSLTDLRFERLHAFAEGLRHCPLMVAEQGHVPVGSIVGENLLQHRYRGGGQSIQLILQGLRSIVRSKDFRRQSLHQFAQVLIQTGGLEKLDRDPTSDSFSPLTVRRSNKSSLPSLFSMNNFTFLYTRASTLTLLVYLIEGETSDAGELSSLSPDTIFA